jgi:DNA-binding response OmpR family regulator
MERIRELRPELVVTDIMMPVMNGADRAGATDATVVKPFEPKGLVAVGARGRSALRSQQSRHTLRVPAV